MKVEGYFDSIKTANEVVAKLKNEGFSGAFVDINEHRNNAYSQSGLVGSKEISSLSSAVLVNGIGEGTNSPLAAASPMASGMGGFEEIANINCKVVVEGSNKDIENAKNIINNMGGTIEDPNGKIPKGIENISEDALILKNLED